MPPDLRPGLRLGLRPGLRPVSAISAPSAHAAHAAVGQPRRTGQSQPLAGWASSQVGRTDHTDHTDRVTFSAAPPRFGRQIQSVDMSPILALDVLNHPERKTEHLWQAFSAWVGSVLAADGVIALRRHGVDFQPVYDTAGAFFNLSLADKEGLKSTKYNGRRGWARIANINKETWSAGASKNLFVNQAPAFEAAVNHFYQQAEPIANVLVAALDTYYQANGALLHSVVDAQSHQPIGTNQVTINYNFGSPDPAALANRRVDDPPSLLPSSSSDGEPRYMRHWPHVDWELLTLLARPTDAGFQGRTKREAPFEDLEADPGEIIVNAGKLLRLMTKDTPVPMSGLDHRVVGTAEQLKQDRVSAAFFVSPHYGKPLVNLHTHQPVNDLGADLSESGRYFYLRSLPKPPGRSAKAGPPQWNDTMESGYRAWQANLAPLLNRE
ncbi:MAG: hypothetical protein KC474_10440 [Cyanobacteria bacterium HKST-UBA04]|nr:hypothetical protein [Cyanobacteria bacterium HKST-UBA04]